MDGIALSKRCGCSMIYLLIKPDVSAESDFGWSV